MKAQQLTIGALVVTAMVLGGFLLNSPVPEAKAGMVESKDDFTLMTAGPTNDEMIIIIDNRNQKLISYRVQNDRINFVASGNLNQLFPAAKRP